MSLFWTPVKVVCLSDYCVAIKRAAGWWVFCEDLWLWIGTVFITSDCRWSWWS